ncbi:MAG: HAD-IIA family hydrolase [bacterium]
MEILTSLQNWFHARRADFDAVVFDVDGVLILDGRPVPGSLEFVDALRNRQTPLALLTNDGNHSIAEKNAFLRHAGFNFQDGEITSCAHGLVEVASTLGLTGKQVFVAGDFGNPSYATAAGLTPVTGLADMSGCAAILIGEDSYDWQTTIDAIVNHLILHPETPLIVPNPDEYYPRRGGGIHVAAGGTARFIAQIMTSYGRPVAPLFLGKPYRPIFAHNHAVMQQRAGCSMDARRVLMVGDSLMSDVCGGHDFGYQTALLLTGITRNHHLEQARLAPDFAFAGY